MLTTNPPEKVGTMLTVAQLMEEGLGGTRDTLFEASTRGDIEHVRYMLDKGASPNAKDFDGDTVLSAAAEAGEAFIVALMLNYGAEVNTLNYIGWTPLIHAVVNDKLEVAFSLIMRGARMNCADTVHERTPLHFAARWGHTRMAKMLLDAGAYAHVPSAEKRTPLEEARRYNHHETADSIEEIMDHDSSEGIQSTEKRLATDYIYTLAPEIATAQMTELQLRQWLRWAVKDLTGDETAEAREKRDKEEALAKISLNLVEAECTSRLALARFPAEQFPAVGIKLALVKFVKKAANAQLPPELRVTAEAKRSFMATPSSPSAGSEAGRALDSRRSDSRGSVDVGADAGRKEGSPSRPSRASREEIKAQKDEENLKQYLDRVSADGEGEGSRPTSRASRLSRGSSRRSGTKKTGSRNSRSSREMTPEP